MSEPSPVKYREMSTSDIPQILTLEAASFPGIPPDRYWHVDMLRAHVEKFQEGQFVAELDGTIVGSATALRVPLTAALTPHSWKSISGGGFLTTHDPLGDALYGTEIMVHPDARRRGIARALYKTRKDLVRRLNLRAFVAGGRIPGYERFAETMTAVEYVKSVLDGDHGDRTLSAQLASGMSVAGVMNNYITDPKSRNHATILVWWNLDFRQLVTPLMSPPTQPPTKHHG